MAPEEEIKKKKEKSINKQADNVIICQKSRIVLIVSAFRNKDIFVANFERKSRYIQKRLFITL